MNITFAKNLVLLAGSKFGWSARLLSRPIPPQESSSAPWREQYARGDWERLWDVSELGRHSVIAGYLAHFAPDGAILDIGCGEGALLQNLRADGYRRYLGIDVAPEAIRKAQRFADDRTMFEAADAATYEPDQTFDAIVFNEVLYYFQNPMALMERYHPWLAPSGVIIVSNCLLRRSVSIPPQIGKSYDVEDEVSVMNRDGVLWSVQFARPRDRSQRAELSLA